MDMTIYRVYIHSLAYIHKCPNSAGRPIISSTPVVKDIPLLKEIRLLGEVVDFKAAARKTENESGISHSVRK